jgi:S1/P1 Nuclease
LIEHWSRDEDRWLAELVARDDALERSFAMDGTLEEWATEGLQAARQAYQDPATGMKIEPGARLAEAYYEANLPLARRQMLNASARLAWVLTDTLRPK